MHRYSHCGLVDSVGLEIDSGRGIVLRPLKNLCIRLNADDITLLPVIEPLTKIRYASTLVFCHDRSVRHPIRSVLINKIQPHLPFFPVMDIYQHVGLLAHNRTFRIIRIIPRPRTKSSIAYRQANPLPT
jgi:hypothetical protein